jgi:hypothetical protein
VSKTAPATGTTLAHVAVPLLGIASGTVGVARRVQATRTWIEPMAMWTAVVGYSGTGKTPGLDAVTKALGKIHEERRPENAKQKRAHEERSQRAKLVLAKWKNDVKTAMESGQPGPPMPVEADDPGSFITPRIYASDMTVERIAQLLEVRRCGLTLIKDELAGLFLNLSRYHDGSDREFYLQSWNGRSFIQERVGRKPIDLDYLILGICGGLPPDKLTRCFDGDHDGMYARMMLAWPEAAPYQPLNDDAAEVEPEIINAMMRLVR